MNIEAKIVSSLGKVFPDKVQGSEIESLSVFADEPASFQLAYRIEDVKRPSLLMYARIESDIKEWEEYKVAYVPVINALPVNPDKYFDRGEPGLFPDILYKRNNNSPVADEGFQWQKINFEKGEKHLINAANSWQSLWFTLGGKKNPLPAGEHSFTIRLYSATSDNLMVEKTFKLEVINATLGEQRLLYTNWFHCDCLADTYNVEMFSDKHFEIIESFAKAAADTGMNMILLPAFTPPLDTSVGCERKTAQLVKVTKTHSGYEFDFTLLERFIKVCQRAGQTHFEHSHLYSQWGAKAAPKIMGYENGEYKQLFGWDTDSSSEEYALFIKSYLRALKPVLQKTGVNKNILFHISDEPSDKHLENYKRCLETVLPEIEGYINGDAISHYDVYKEAKIHSPIISVNSGDMPKFIENAPNRWLYYTGESLVEGFTNRLITTTAPRCRVVGVQMFYFDMKGFLHWGFNYYYDKLSHGLCDVKVNPCNYGNYPGTSFMCYPNNDGTALSSTRMKIFYEGILDYEALMKLSELAGREAAIKLIEDFFGEMKFTYCPEDDLTLINFRKVLNDEIKKYI
ncbi:MAG: DUF4091 domain-containing protein [Clostridia bacterium]|nr:DUF4091 domain-containing protein [Clostridia bacterium]